MKLKTSNTPVAKKVYAIRIADPEKAYRFALFDPEGNFVTSGPSPRKLSAQAFAVDADEVEWRFDLKLAEDT